MFNKNKSFWAAFHNKQMENLDDALKDTNRTVQDMPGKVPLQVHVTDLRFSIGNTTHNRGIPDRGKVGEYLDGRGEKVKWNHFKA